MRKCTTVGNISSVFKSSCYFSFVHISVTPKAAGTVFPEFLLNVKCEVERVCLEPRLNDPFRQSVYPHKYWITART